MNDSTATEDPTAAMFGEATDMFTRMWSDFATKMASNGFTMPRDQSPQDAAKQMRDTFFAAWSDACEKYMRSSEFQQMMRDSMKAAIELRKQMNEQMGQMQHTMQGASRQDIDKLMQNVQNLEGRFAETYEQLVDCLEAVTTRLDKLEGSEPKKTSKPKAATKGKAKAAPKKRTKKKPR